MKDKDELDWLPSDSEISLGEERAADDEEEDFLYNPEFVETIEGLHRFPELTQYMYPETKEDEAPTIMDDVEAFRYGFKFPESAHRNLTKSTLSKILKNFVDYGHLPDSLFVLGNVRFLTELFDLKVVKEQVKAYLTSPYTTKSDDFVIALEYMLSYPRVTEAEKRLVKELLEFLKE